MPKLEAQLDNLPTQHKPTKRGPRPSCDVYGEGTLEDWEAVQKRRNQTSWDEAQMALNKVRGIATPIPNGRFRYHWNRHCGCWPEDLRI